MGALFTAAVCWALGSRLFARLENGLLASLCGAAVLSLVVFLFCVLQIAYAWVFAIFGIGALVCARWTRPSFVRPPLLFCGLFFFYALLYLSNSLAPEISPDGSAYHLGLVSEYFRHHGFPRITTNMYASLSQGMEMLFLFAFAFGGHTSAATVHCFALLTLPLLMLDYGRRVGHAAAGGAAGLLVYLSPVVGVDGVSAYNDVGLALASFAVFCLVERNRTHFLAVGLMAGFCFGIKYTGFAALLYVLVRAPLAAGAGALVASPWLIKNWIVVWNPIAPFLNRWFRNPFVHITFEDFYRGYFHNYGLTDFSPLFWMVTVSGQLGGHVGPLFLFAPVGLLALRSPIGRRVLLAGLFFLIPYPQNIGARFLIPALPFVAFAIALALESSRTALATLSIVAAILAWPRVIDKYRAPAGGWQIATMPWQAALHIVPHEVFLSRRFAPYNTAQMINANVPADKTLWSSGPLAEAYVARRVIVNYYSAEGELIEDMLLTSREGRRLRFNVPARIISRFRLTQTAWDVNAVWSIAEARFYAGADEIRPAKAVASVFPWDSALMLDGNPATRWRSWEPLRPGMHVDFEFAGPVRIDRLEIDTSRDQDQVQFDMKFEQQDTLIDPRPLSAVKARGIDYLLINDNSRIPKHGLRAVAASGPDKLYQLQ